jgi:DNA recombination protein RmuC
VVILGLLIGLAVGASAALLVARARTAAAISRLQADVALERGRLEAAEHAAEQLENAFKALSADALRNNNEAFLQLARSQFEQLRSGAAGDLEQRRQAVEQLVAPIRESLQRFDGKVHELERARTEAYGSLTAQVRTLAEGQRELRHETSSLVTALRAPAVRGRWGEMQLRRVVEAAGMVAYCDFAEQTTLTTDGARTRPDLIVNLAGGKHVVVDAKAPLEGYLAALEARTEEERQARLADHARQLRDHVLKLGAKSYWTSLEATPEFVVLFIPGETFFSAALEQDPTLIEEAAKRQVILSTPTTLIAVLWAIAHGWREERLAENARAISELGRDLHTRLGTLASHFTKLKRSIDAVVRSYNDAAGSLESRVLVSARKLRDLGATSTGEIGSLAPVEQIPRALSAPEVAPPADDDDALPAADAA